VFTCVQVIKALKSEKTRLIFDTNMNLEETTGMSDFLFLTVFRDQHRSVFYFESFVLQAGSN
jgi:hypothetical protein